MIQLIWKSDWDFFYLSDVRPRYVRVEIQESLKELQGNAIPEEKFTQYERDFLNDD